MTCGGLTEAKAFVRDAFVNQGRKPEDRRRLETVVVPAVNYADRVRLNIINLAVPEEKSRVFGLWGEYERKFET